MGREEICKRFFFVFSLYKKNTLIVGLCYGNYMTQIVFVLLIFLLSHSSAYSATFAYVSL